MIIYLLFSLSLVLNLFIAWYCFNLLKDRVALVELFKEFFPVIKSYEAHLDSLSKMDVYFGDPTIMALVKHTKEVSSKLEDSMRSIEIEETNETKE